MSTEMANYGDKRMTVKEVAEALNVSDRTVRRHAEAMHLTSNGIETLLTETQVTAIKMAIERSGRNDLDNVVQVAGATTELEMMMLDAKVSAWKNRRIEELTAINLSLNNKLAIVTPKAELADRLTSSEDAIDLGTVSKVLALPFGRNTLFSILRGKKILMSDNRPYQEYMDRGYFRVIEEPFEVKGKTKINFKTLAYQRGVDFIRKTIEAEK